MNGSLISVIIVNWNGANYLPACLAALLRQTYTPFELVIVDNASTDKSGQILDEFQRQYEERGSPPLVVPPSGGISPLKRELQTEKLQALTIIRNTWNEGFCRGNNQGIQASHGDFVLLLNADVTLEPDFIARVVDVMHSDPEIGIAVGKLLNGHDPSRIDSTGIVILKNRRALDRGQQEREAGQYNRREEVFGASGAACLYRKTMLEHIKYPHDEYLDQLFFAYKEDVDLSWRARLQGWKCVYTPDAVGTHFRTWGTGKRRDIPKWVRRHSLKNRYLMLLKNECWQTLHPSLLHIVWYEIRSCLYILFWEPYLCAVIGEILRARSEIFQKRRITQDAVTKTAKGKLCIWFQN